MAALARVIFAGTPDFAVPALAALHDADVEIVAVYTQPDRPAGRGRKITASPVKQWALTRDLPVIQPESLKIPAAQQTLASLEADLMLVVAYGQILSADVLVMPRLGCVNIHASLLPRWRGAAPIQRAVMSGDPETGVTLMQMDTGMDTGAILASRPYPIATDRIAADLHDALAQLGAELLTAKLTRLLKGELPATPQDDSLASYANKIQKSEAWLDWQEPATVLAAKIRAFNSWPVAQTRWQESVLRIWRGQAVDGDIGDAKPGTVISAGNKGLHIACGRGVLEVLELQAPGGKVLQTAEFLNAHTLTGQEFY